MPKVKTQKIPQKNPPGRPRLVINYEQLKELCELQCTGEECAAVLGCHYETLNIRLREDYEEAKKRADETGEEMPVHVANGFLEYFKQFRQGGLVSLRRAQFENAVKEKNASMQKWLGIQLLNQKERIDYSSEDGSMTPVKAIADMTLEELKKEARARGLPETIFDN